MKTTIFQKILFATLVPSVLIFAVLFTFIYGIFKNESKNGAKSIVENYTRYAAETIYNTLRNYEIELQLLSRYIPKIITEYDDPENSVSKFIYEFLEADPSLSSAWVVLEKGVIKDSRVIKTVTRHKGRLTKDDAFNESLLDDPVLADWYHIPVRDGKVFFNPLDLYDNGVSDNIEARPFYNCDIAFPIWENGEVIGAVGFDFLYSSLFSTVDNLQKENQTAVVLLSADLNIMYSYKMSMQGKNFLEMAADSNNAEKLAEIEQAIKRREFFSTDYFSFSMNAESLFNIIPISISKAESTIFLYTVTADNVLYKTSDDALKTILNTCIVSIIVLATCVFFASKRIAVPIKNLTETSDKIAAGDFEVDFGLNFNPDSNTNFDTIDFSEKKEKDELTRLKISLGTMVSKLKQAHIADMKRVEAEHEKEQIQASSDAKMVFFANMSHEIRTPMNSILGITQILLHEEDLSEKQRKYISDIKISSDSLLDIINDILDLSKLESRKMSLSPIDYNFIQFMDSICSFSVFLAEQKKLDFRYHIIGETPVCLFGDDTRLRQIVLNIIGNAVKFTQNGYISLTVIIEENTVIFEIKDTGIGIKPENIPHLFRAYEQVKDKKTRDSVGTGLGLSISKSLVEIMGGEISVESEYGKGSTFRVVVPKINGDVKNLADRKSADSKIYFSPETKILVVDDNEINLHVASGLLETLFGLECDLAQSGAEALSLISGTDYDIVFMDHMMPEMDGVETTHRIREMEGKYENLVIIALTANAVVGTKALLIQSGMNDFLSKPIDKNELENMLLKWLPKEKCLNDKTDFIKMKNDSVYSEIITKAEKIAGLDVLAGLNSIAFNQEVYEKSLRILSLKIPDTLEVLPKYLAEGNCHNFSVYIHGMKSSLASLGATSLSKLALKLEKASKNNDVAFCRETLPVFLSQLSNFGEQLKMVFGSLSETKEKEPATKTEFFLMAENFYAFIYEYNYESAMVMMQKLESCDFGKELNEHVNKVKYYFESFDYEAIKGYLDDLFYKETAEKEDLD